MLGPCRCREDFSDDQPTIEDLKAALAQSLIEIDAYRMMLDFPTFEMRRTFTCAELEEAAKCGLTIRLDNGSLVCWPES